MSRHTNSYDATDLYDATQIQGIPHSITGICGIPDDAVFVGPAAEAEPSAAKTAANPEIDEKLGANSVKIRR